ncbi:GNAT family N-acetyltransferase [Pseudaestuariivita atlantica]|uniref:GCN5 family acetyltransferase n=1 Tax=Pseudaestuariivita atlantica TaxID=1317121 RepID=A0A0L1JKX6_9RHOB|nr:GNAT family N-acetyltransferase [Pseudaestuariivita atlantica]KNG92377.1 GCN5 family acetyltransferase [Pseudaestuariivita atlantica]
MTLTPGFHAAPPGHVATVVTHLEMSAPPATLANLPDDTHLAPLDTATPDTYRDLFRAVGQDWLWFSRLRMSDDDLTAILTDPAYDAFALRRGDADLGLLELDFREENACELAFFGLTQAAIGTGLGRALMGEATRRAFARPITRFHVHTCTLDSPQAMPFYRHSGFTAVRQEVEIAPDPRLTGDLPRNAAPQIPIIEA